MTQTGRAPLSSEQPAPPRPRSDGRRHATPLARRRAAQLGLDLALLAPDRERVLARDVIAAPRPGSGHRAGDAGRMTLRFDVAVSDRDARALAGSAAFALTTALRRGAGHRGPVTGLFVVLDDDDICQHLVTDLEDLDAAGIGNRLTGAPRQASAPESATIVVVSGLAADCRLPVPDGVLGHVSISAPVERVVAVHGALAIRRMAHVTVNVDAPVVGSFEAVRVANSILCRLNEGVRAAP